MSVFWFCDVTTTESIEKIWLEKMKSIHPVTLVVVRSEAVMCYCLFIVCCCSNHVGFYVGSLFLWCIY